MRGGLSRNLSGSIPVLSGNKGLAAWGWLGDGVGCLGRLVLPWAWLGLAGLAGLVWAGLGSTYGNRKMIQTPLSPFSHKTNTHKLLMICVDWGASENQQNINNKHCKLHHLHIKPIISK